MSRPKKWPEGKVILTLLEVGKDQADAIAAARDLIRVEFMGDGSRPMFASELCREALHFLVDHLRAGSYRAPEKPRPGEARIVEVGKWDGE